jgi:phenylacetic acid degradation operon negative regulatory protein
VGETTGGANDRDVPTRLLVLGLAHQDGTILAADVAPVAEACGHTTEQVRSCLRRLVTEGLFVRDGTGRDALYRPTEAGVTALTTAASRARLAYVQDRAGQGWDGRWHLVAFAVPEPRRAARDALRDHLGALGGAPVQSGLYVSPHPWEKDVATEAERLGITGQVSLASTDDLAVGGESDPADLAHQLWPVSDLADRYRAFVTTWGHVSDELEHKRRRHERLPEWAFLAGALAMGVAFLSCFEGDPLLPPELLPRLWPGREARDLVLRSRRLALQIRAEHDRPALFRAFDDLIEALP